MLTARKELDASSAPELYSIVNELAHSAGIPMPRLYLIDTDTPNAFATGRNVHHAAVAVTRGIMRICTRDELKGVIGHELSHVINHDILTSSIAATMAGAVMMIGSMIRWGAIFGLGNRDDEEGGIAGLLIAGILAPIAATLIQLAISRTREYQADASGAKLTHNPLYLASALRKLEAANERMPLDASPATAHLFIVNPLSAAGNLAAVLDPSADRGANPSARADGDVAADRTRVTRDFDGRRRRQARLQGPGPAAVLRRRRGQTRRRRAVGERRGDRDKIPAGRVGGGAGREASSRGCAAGGERAKRANRRPS